MSFAIRSIPEVVSAVLLSLSYSAFAQPSGTNGVAPGHARPAQPTPGAPAASMPGMAGQPMPGMGGQSMPGMAGQPRSGDGSAGKAAPAQPMAPPATASDQNAMVDALPYALALPATQVVVDRLPGWKVMRQ